MYDDPNTPEEVNIGFNNHPEHITSIRRIGDGDYKATCSCGAKWTYKRTAKFEEMFSIYESHLAYFNRPKLEIL